MFGGQVLGQALVAATQTVDHRAQMASLDHAVWFQIARVDEWLLLAYESPSATGARALARGLVYARGGQLLATTAQAGLVRTHRPGAMTVGPDTVT